MVVVLLSVALVTLTVLFHYEGLIALQRLWIARNWHGRASILAAIYGVIALHLIEIAIYAAAFWFGDTVLNVGGFGGVRPITLIDYVYFSAEAFSSLGLGDIYPFGDLRLLAGVETLNGMILIGWSASFTYLIMQRVWETSLLDHDGPQV